MQLNSEWRFVHYFPARGYAVRNGKVLNLDRTECALLFQNRGLLRQLPTAVIPQRLEPLVISGDTGGAHVCVVPTQHHLRRVQLEINEQCNLSCSHCYSSSAPGGSVGMSAEDVQRLIAEARDLGTVDFYITGGEPLIRKDIFKHLEAVTALGMRGGLFTNATLLTPQKVDRLAAAGLGFVQSSLDGHTAELHDAIRNKRGAFAKAIAGIRLLKESGVYVRVNVCATRSNVTQIPEIADFMASELGVPFYIDRGVPAGRALMSNEHVTGRDLYEIIAPLMKDRAMFLPSCGHEEEGQETAVEPECGVGSSYAYVKHDGRVAMCPTMTEGEGFLYESHRFPERSLKEVWSSNRTFLQYRSMQCVNVNVCPAGARCKGGCRSDAHILHGSVGSPDEYFCNLYKNDSMQYVNFLAQYSTKKKRVIPLSDMH